MIGKCNLQLIYHCDNKDIRWLVNKNAIIKDKRPHYKHIQRLDGLCSVRGLKSLFLNTGDDERLGILDSDVVTKLDIQAYFSASELLRQNCYKFNKKTQKLIEKKI